MTDPTPTETFAVVDAPLLFQLGNPYFALPNVKIYFDPPRVEIAEGVTMDDAAQQFWDAVRAIAARST